MYCRRRGEWKKKNVKTPNNNNNNIQTDGIRRGDHCRRRRRRRIYIYIVAMNHCSVRRPSSRHGRTCDPAAATAVHVTRRFSGGVVYYYYYYYRMYIVQFFSSPFTASSS